MTKAPDMSTRELLAFYYKHRTRLIGTFLVWFLFFVAVSFIPAPRYDASSVLIVRLGSEYVYKPEVDNNRGGPEAALPFDRDQIFKSEVAILESDDLHEKTVQALTLEKLYPDMVKPGILDPVLVPIKDFIDTAMLEMGLEQPLTEERRSHRLLGKAVARFDRHLDIALERDSAVITVTFQNRDPAVAVQALDTLLKLYMEKRKQLYLEPRAELAEAQVTSMHEKALAAETAAEDFKRANKIHSLPDQRVALLQARSEIEKEQTKIINAALKDKIGYYDNQLNRLDGVEREYGRLQHEKQVAEDEYALSLHKLNEAKAFENLERERTGSVRIIQPPTAPDEPKPLQLWIILAGLFFAIIATGGRAAWIEYVETGFTTPERLERKTGLSVLAVVSLKKNI